MNTQTKNEAKKAGDPAALPQICNGIDLCGNGANVEACWRAVAKSHEINDASVFFTSIQPETQAGPGKYYAAEKAAQGKISIRDILEKGKCKTHFIHIDNTVKKNADIIPVAKTGGDLLYSYQMLYGILADKPEYFTFFLGKNAGTVLFSVRFSDGKNRYYDFFKVQEAATTSTRTAMAHACDDDSWCRIVAARHRIDQSIFQQDLDWFWRADPRPVPDARTWTIDMAPILNDGDCSLVWLNVQGSDGRTDNKVTFIYEGLPFDRKIAKIDARYSIEVFKGIHLLTGAEEFRFYKGLRANNQETILIEVVCSDGSLQYYDLSNERP